MSYWKFLLIPDSKGLPPPLISMPTSLTQYTLSSTDSPPPMMVNISGGNSGSGNNSLMPHHGPHSMVASNSINSNLLTATVGPEDQMRRCSHDPNIEKLHKSYINNVKLSSAAQVLSSVSVSTDNTDSMPNLSAAGHNPRSTETETDDERGDVLNEIGTMHAQQTTKSFHSTEI